MTTSRSAPPTFALDPPSLVSVPRGLATLCEGPYRVRFAQDEDDLEQVLRLRFEVFNRELGEGLEGSWRSGLDRDRFDAVCHHLMLVEAASGAVVGTYRLQTAEQARAGAGLYCAGEFELAPLAPIVAKGVELGRACIAREHRQGSALFALWRGLAAYLAWSRKRYLFGCCSLTSRDPRQGLALHRRLAREGHVDRRFALAPLSALACIDPRPSDPEPAVELPKLFGTYLRYGARVVSQPALDREFGTIDYLVVLDARALPLRLWRLFFAGLPGSPAEIVE
jgi:putative hemolysin